MREAIRDAAQAFREAPTLAHALELRALLVAAWGAAR